MALNDIILNRRQAIIAGANAVVLAGLAGCSDSSDSGTSTSTSSSTSASSSEGAIDKDAFDAIIKAGEAADASVISASEWASKVKSAGSLRVGSTRTSELISYLDETDNTLRGFDAGLYQLLTAYILGDATKFDFTQVTSDTRESVLQNDQVDAVFATYSITDKRKALIDFAGPYFTAHQGILVMASNTDINSAADLDGKNVAVQSGSTGPSIVEEVAPKAVLSEYSTDEEARAALEQGRVDAYVIDETLQEGSIVANPGKYRLVSETIGPDDPYGIGLAKGSDAVDFVNAFLQKVEDDGVWKQLWKVCIGDRTGQTEAPEPPTIGA